MTDRADILTPERFAQGLTYAEWKASLTKNQELYAWWEEHATVADTDAAFFKEAGERLGGPLKLLLIGEDWCGDVIRELPTIALLAEKAGMDVRVFPRDQNEDLMNLYLNKGEFKSIPVVAIFTNDFRELGHWIERAKETSAFSAKVRAEIIASIEGEPDQQAIYGGVRARMQQEYVNRLHKETLRELQDLVPAAVS